jgi:hypothetical protein
MALKLNLGTLTGGTVTGGITIGRTASSQFAGESKSEMRERKAFDRKARRKGELTSSMLWERGIYWKTGKALPSKYAAIRRQTAVDVVKGGGVVESVVASTKSNDLVNSMNNEEGGTFFGNVIKGIKRGAVEAVVDSEQGKKAKKELIKEWLKKNGAYALALLIIGFFGVKALLKWLKARKKTYRRR